MVGRTVTFDVDDRRVVQQPVEDRGGDHLVAEDLTPAGQALVGRDQDRPPLVAPRHQLKKQVGPQPVQRQVADLIDDQKLGLDELLELFVQTALLVGSRQGGDQAGRRGEGGAVAQSARFQPQPHGQMSLAHSRRAKQQHIVRVGQETARCQLTDHLRVDGRLKLEVEAVQALLEGKARHRRLHRRVTLLLGGQLAAEDLLQKVTVGELSLARLLKQQGQLGRRTDQLQSGHVRLQPFDLHAAPAHDATSSSSRS